MIGFVLTLFGMVILGFVVGRYLLQGSSVLVFRFLRQSSRSSPVRNCSRWGIIGNTWLACTRA